MLHRQRFWQVVPAASAEWLSEALTQSTWCGCNGFALDAYLFLNDATSADGAQEYGVLRNDTEGYVQIESVTFSWMTPERALDLIRCVLSGNYDAERYGFVERHRVQTPARHGRCHFCM